MKARFLAIGMTIVLATTLVCSAGNEKAVQSPQAERKPPTIRVVGLSPEFAGEDHQRVLFEAVNPNDAPLPYRGYLAEGFAPPLPKGVIAPHYTLEFRRDAAWKPEPIGWCGTGAGPVALPPRGTAKFAVDVAKDGWDAFKVGILWYSIQDRTGNPTITWSDPVTRDEIQKLADKKSKDRPMIEKQKDGAEAELAQPKGARTLRYLLPAQEPGAKKPTAEKWGLAAPVVDNFSDPNAIVYDQAYVEKYVAWAVDTPIACGPGTYYVATGDMLIQVRSGLDERYLGQRFRADDLMAFLKTRTGGKTVERTFRVNHAEAVKTLQEQPDSFVARRLRQSPWERDTHTVIGLLSMAQHKPAYPLFKALLKDPSKEVQASAIMALGRIAAVTPEAIKDLSSLMPDKELGRVATDSLTMAGAAAVPTLIEAMNHADYLVRNRAVHALVRIDPFEAALPGLMAALEHKDKTNRLWALSVVVDLQGRGVAVGKDELVDVLARRLLDGDVEIRASAALALVNLKAAAIRARPALAKAAAQDEDSRVRRYAAQALQALDATDQPKDDKSPENKKKAPSPIEGNWQKSEDDVVALQLAVRPTKVIPGESVKITATLRNISDKTITVVRPFWGPRKTFHIEITGPKGKLRFDDFGIPPPKLIDTWWELGGALQILKPGASFQDTVRLDWEHYPDLREPASYRFAFAYVPKDSLADRKGVINFWKGKIPAVSVAVEVQLPDVAATLKKLEAGDKKEKLEALRELSRTTIAKPDLELKSRAIKLLVELMKDKDRELGSAACDTLSWFDAEAAPLLAELLQSNDGYIQSDAARAISSIASRHPAQVNKLDVTIPHLAKVLKGDPKTSGRHNAFHAIAGLGPAAIPPMVAELEAEEYFQWVMTEGFVRNADEAVAPLCIALRTGSVTARQNAAYQLFHISWRAEKAGQILEKKALSALTEAIQDTDKLVRSRVMDTLGRMGSRARPALDKIVASIDDADPPLRSIAHAVSLIGTETKHLDKLFAGAERIFRATKSEGDRDIAVSGFGEAVATAGEEGVDRVIRGLDDEREGARSAAMWALYFLGPKGARAVPVVIRKLNDGDTRAIDVLGAIGPKAKDAVPHLIRRLEKDEWAQPRSGRSLIHLSTAARALAAIGADAIPALLEGLKQKNELVVVGCMIALAEMDAKAKVPRAPLVPHTRHDNAIIRMHAMLGLIKQGLPKDELTPILERLQKDAHPAIASAARKELERLHP